MPLIRRTWTAAEADEWTREDWITIFISPICYIMMTLGVALSILLLWEGFVLLIGSIILTAAMHWIIDPKLKAVSADYETKQQDYLRTLEDNVRWHHTEGDEA